MTADRLSFDQRRRFLEALRTTLEAARPYTLTAVLMTRVPRIHDINMIFSHDAANVLVCAVIDRISAATREFDIVIGIEDPGFALILPNLQGTRRSCAASSTLRTTSA